MICGFLKHSFFYLQIIKFDALHRPVPRDCLDLLSMWYVSPVRAVRKVGHMKLVVRFTKVQRAYIKVGDFPTLIAVQQAVTRSEPENVESELGSSHTEVETLK